MHVIDIYFVLLPNTLLLDLSGPAEVFAMANRCQPIGRDGAPMRFKLHYICATDRIDTSIGLVLQGLAGLPETLEPEAMVFLTGTIDPGSPISGTQVDRPPGISTVPGPVIGTSGASIAKTGITPEIAQTITWLKTVAGFERRIACICAGALVAARAGLLDGRLCTTHHTDCAELQQLAPTAKVLDNRLFVNDGPISTSAGVTAGIDLALQIAAELCGPQVAAAVARNMVVYARRSGTDPQLSPWLGGRNHLHPALHRVQDAIAADPAHHWSMPELAGLACSSERHLARLFKDFAQTNAVDYIHRLRVALARELLAGSSLDLERIAERSGFGSARQMRRVWQKFDASPPGQWRQDHGLRNRDVTPSQAAEHVAAIGPTS